MNWAGAASILDKHGFSEFFERFHSAVAASFAPGCRHIDPDHDIEVANLAAEYLDWAEEYYRASAHYENIRRAVAATVKLYGHQPVTGFGPKALKAVRQTFIDDKLARSTCNRYTGFVWGMFKSGVADEIVPAAVFHALDTVAGLRRGCTNAPETEPIKPVVWEQVEAIRAYVPYTVWTASLSCGTPEHGPKRFYRCVLATSMPKANCG